MSEKAPTEKKWDVYGYEEHLRTLTPEKLLGELLATLHSDGGHHTEEVGLAQSVIDAMNNHKSKREAALQVVREAVEEELDLLKNYANTMKQEAVCSRILSRIESKLEES